MTKVWIVEGRKIGTAVTHGKYLERLLAEAREYAGDNEDYLEECDYAEACYAKGDDVEIEDVFRAERVQVIE